MAALDLYIDYAQYKFANFLGQCQKVELNTFFFHFFAEAEKKFTKKHDRKERRLELPPFEGLIENYEDKR